MVLHIMMYSEMSCRSHIDHVTGPSKVQLSSAVGARYIDHAYFASIARSLDSGEIFLNETSFEEDLNYSRVSTLSPRPLESCWHGLEEKDTLRGDEDEIILVFFSCC
jgi:hypothetical protein